jgi:transposase-like protein
MHSRSICKSSAEEKIRIVIEGLRGESSIAELCRREGINANLYYNNERYHESLENLTPADVYFGRARQIKSYRHQIKMKTLKERRKINRKLST